MLAPSSYNTLPQLMLPVYEIPDGMFFNEPDMTFAKELYVAPTPELARKFSSLGITAVCPEGGLSKWKPRQSELERRFGGKKVYCLSEAGYDHDLQHVASTLLSIANSVKLIRFDDIPLTPSGSAWLELGRTKEQLEERVACTPLFHPNARLTQREFGLSFMRGRDFLQQETEIEALIEGLLGRKEALLLCATSGLGKSLVTNQMGITCGLDGERKLFGVFSIPNKLTTLFVQAENGDQAVIRRLKKMSEDSRERLVAVEEQLFTASVNNCGCISGDIGDDAFLEGLKRIILKTQADLIVIDPLISFINGSENDNCKMRELLDKLFKIITDANASLILVHHVAKSGNQYSQGGRGAQAISDWAPNIVKLCHPKDSKDGKKILFQQEKARNFAIEQPEITLYRDDNLWFEIDPHADEKELKEKAATAVSALEKHGKPFHSQKDFIAAMMELDDIKKTEAQRRIQAALDAGSIIATDIPKSRSKLYSLSQ